MAAINDLIAQIQDAELRNKIEQEVNRMNKQKKFGLVFEEHLPECTPLYEMPVNCGSNVALKFGNINDIYRVIAINNEKALCMKEDEKTEWNIADLMLNVIPMQLNWLRVMILKSVTMELRNY